ncbi:hypothetical protein [Haloferula sargassicola]|uniref:Uncharacterized protein n=1 Tax=Haloferula sargassicola TaxID=490096 RepID=A0ABP9UXB4_9BACT
MQLIDPDHDRRRILTADQSARVLAAIEDGHLSIDLEEVMDFDGDLVLDVEQFQSCIELAVARAPNVAS